MRTFFNFTKTLNLSSHSFVHNNNNNLFNQRLTDRRLVYNGITQVYERCWSGASRLPTARSSLQAAYSQHRPCYTANTAIQKLHVASYTLHTVDGCHTKATYRSRQHCLARQVPSGLHDGANAQLGTIIACIQQFDIILGSFHFTSAASKKVKLFYSA